MLAQSSLAQTPALPALPRVYLDTTYVAPTGKRITVNAGGNLQKALNDAQPGDEIVLQAGATFTGNFVLPTKTSGAGWITVRGSGMDSLPRPGNRVHPSDAAHMPKIVTSGSASALATQPGAHHYRIMGVEIAVAPKVTLNYSTVYLGDGNTPEQLPTDIVFDRVYIHGGVLCHCKQGIIMNSRRTAIIDSYISEYHTIDQDAQAILGYNGPGPFKIVNNYLEASTENIMFGGSAGAIPGVIPSDIEFRRNYLAKPVRWMTGILPKPRSVAAAPGGGGNLSAGTWYYTIVAAGPGDYAPFLNSPPADELAVMLAGGQNSVSLSWPAVYYGDSTDTRQATRYQVFRTPDPPSSKSRKWVSFTTSPAGSLSFTDTGDAGTAAPLPAATRWMVKNLFELKNAQRVLVDSNVMEFCWEMGQVGFAILALPRSEAGKMPWAVTQDLTFTHNLIRHASGAAAIGGSDDASACRQSAVPCARSSRVLFRDNLFDDLSSKKWRGRGWVIQLLGIDDVTIDHNTAINDSFSFWLGGKNARLALTNNIAVNHVIGDSALGQMTFRMYAPDVNFSSNLLIAASANNYDPAGKNLFPPSIAAVGFRNHQTGDYRLSDNSPYKHKAADGRDPGADITAVQKAVAGVTAGKSDPASPPAIAFLLNAVSLAADFVAPGSLISVFGINLAGIPAEAVTDPLPGDLGDAVLAINGSPVPLLSVNAGQIDAQLPFELPPGPNDAVVVCAGVASAPFTFSVAPSAPALYLADTARALAFNADGTLNGPSNPAPAGAIVTAYLTGQGQVEPPVPTGAWSPAAPLSFPVLPVAATVGGRHTDVLFAGLTPASIGVFQVSLTVPELSPGEHPLVITVGEAHSKPAFISIS